MLVLRRHLVYLRNNEGTDVDRAQCREIEEGEIRPTIRGQIISALEDMGRTLDFILNQMGNHLLTASEYRFKFYFVFSLPIILFT